MFTELSKNSNSITMLRNVRFQKISNGFNTLVYARPFLQTSVIFPFQTFETDSHICPQIHFTFMYSLTAAAYHSCLCQEIAVIEGKCF